MDLERGIAVPPYVSRVLAKGTSWCLQKCNSKILEGHVLTDLVKLGVGLSTMHVNSNEGPYAHFDQVWSRAKP